MKKIRIGTRKSRLALIQAKMVKQAIEKTAGGIEVEIVGITTEGDILSKENKDPEKGVFVKRIEELILSGEIDAGIHSTKDMPAILPDGLETGAFLKREDARDVFITLSDNNFSSLPDSFKIGTSSPRRKAMILENCKGVEVVNIRGNVDTRLKKLGEGEVDGLLLAAAGIIRLGYSEMITEYLSPDIFIPAAGQGAICIEISSGNSGLSELTGKIDDYETRVSVCAERAFISEIGAGCNLPVGVHCSISGEKFLLQCKILSLNGKESLRGEIEGSIKSAIEYGRQLASEMIDKGAKDFF